MATANFVGFETGDSSEVQVTFGTFSIQSTVKRTGGYALRANPTTTGTGGVQIGGVAANGTNADASIVTSYIRVYFQYLTKPAANEEQILGFFTAGGAARKFSLRITSGGVLKAYNAADTLVGTGTTVLSSGTWYRIEVECGTGSSGAAWEVMINGVSEISGTTNLNTNNAARVFLGKALNVNGQSVDFYYDDFFWSDSGYLSNVETQCTLLSPVANGTNQTWTVGAGSGSHYQIVNEIPPDGDTSYLLSPLVIQDLESEFISNYSSNGINGDVISISPFIIVKRNAVNATVRGFITDTAANYFNSTYTTTASYAYISAVLDQSLTTGFSWTLKDLVGMEVGAENESASLQVRMTSMGIMVYYAPAPETNVSFIGTHKPASFNRRAFAGIRSGFDSEFSTDTVANPHYIGTFHPAKVTKAAFGTLFQVNVHDDSDPQFNQAPQTYSIGKFTPSRYFPKAAFVGLRSVAIEDDTAPVETNVSFIGTHKPTRFNKAVYVSLRGVFVGDETAPVETNIENIGHFQPARYNKAAYVALRQGITEDQTAPVETDVNFIGIHHPTVYRKAAFNPLIDVSVHDDSDPQFNQEPQTYSIGFFRRTQISSVAIYMDNRNFLVEDTGDPTVGQAPLTYSIGKFTPTTFARGAYQGLFQNFNEGLNAPFIEPHTIVDFIPKFHPVQFNKAAYAGLWAVGNQDDITEFVVMQRGQYRIQNLNAVGYLLYVGVNDQPDFNADAAIFSASLPVSLSYPLPGSGVVTLNVVPRLRDSYGCISQNAHASIILLTPTGPIFPPVPPPLSVTALPQGNGNIRVIGQYPTYSFEAHPADRARYWVGTTIPDTTMTPTFEDAVTGTIFQSSFGSYAPGTYYVAVALYRTSDGFQSGIVLTTVVFPPIPDAPMAVFTEHVTDP